MTETTANILVQCSDYYSVFCGVMLTSLYENNKHLKNINVYVLDDNISNANKDKMCKSAENYNRRLTYISTQEIVSFLSGLNVPKYHGSYTTLYKLFAITRIEDDIDKILYIDSDMLINGRIDELINENLDNYLCGMVAHTTAYQYKKKIGFDHFDMWFNGGLIYFNIKKWKEIDAEKQIIKCFKNPNITFSLADEDAVNILFHDLIKPLNLKFNYPSTYDALGLSVVKYAFDLTDAQVNDFLKAKNAVVIYHCFTIFGKRPWESGCILAETPLWNQMKQISEWKDYTIPEKPLSVTYKIEYLLHKLLPNKLYALIHKIMYRRFLNNSSKTFSYKNSD